MSFARLDVFGRGEVSGMMKAGLDREAISKLVKKRDWTFKTLPSGTLADTIRAPLLY